MLTALRLTTAVFAGAAVPFEDGKTTKLMKLTGLQRAIRALWLIYNWSRPHLSLAKGTTPTRVMG
jgi:hypothetical protein